MVETRRLKNVVIVMQTILSLVLWRKIFGNVSIIEGARTIFDLPIILELFQLLVGLWVSFTIYFSFMY